MLQNPFNYSKRFNIILEINEGKLVHNYGNFNYKYMYFLKKCIFFENFYLITGKNNKEKTTKLNNKLHLTSSLDDSFNATRHAVYQLLTFMGSYLIPTSLDGIFQLLRSIWVDVYAASFSQSPINFRWDSNEVSWQASLAHVRGNSHTMLVWILQSGFLQSGARSCWKMNSLSPKS